MSDQYTPTTEEVLDAYVDRKDFLDAVTGLERRGDDVATAEFWRWLNKIKAEAWEQGKRAEETAWIHVLDGHPVEEGDMCDQCPTDNPYREQEVT